MKKLAFIICGSTMWICCAHHKNVRPGVNNIHKVTIMAADKESGSEDAIVQANHFCKQFEKIAAIVAEKVEYVGDVSEQAYKAGKKVSNIGKLLGVRAGSHIADEALGKGYRIDMDFECKTY